MLKWLSEGKERFLIIFIVGELPNREAEDKGNQFSIHLAILITQIQFGAAEQDEGPSRPLQTGSKRLVSSLHFIFPQIPSLLPLTAHRNLMSQHETVRIWATKPLEDLFSEIFPTSSFPQFPVYFTPLAAIHFRRWGWIAKMSHCILYLWTRVHFKWRATNWGRKNHETTEKGNPTRLPQSSGRVTLWRGFF